MNCSAVLMKSRLKKCAWIVLYPKRVRLHCKYCYSKKEFTHCLNGGETTHGRSKADGGIF